MEGGALAVNRRLLVVVDAKAREEEFVLLAALGALPGVCMHAIPTCPPTGWHRKEWSRRRRRKRRRNGAGPGRPDH
jgi:hypothetical protein